VDIPVTVLQLLFAIATSLGNIYVHTCVRTQCKWFFSDWSRLNVQVCAQVFSVCGSTFLTSTPTGRSLLRIPTYFKREREKERERVKEKK
jgi:hypothetical protein